MLVTAIFIDFQKVRLHPWRDLVEDIEDVKSTKEGYKHY